MDNSAVDQAATDPLSGVTRTERRWLLILNVAVATMSYGGMVPSEIDALGLRSAQLNQNVIFFIVLLLALYFLCSFSLYVTPDFKAWKERVAHLKATFIEKKLSELDLLEPGFRDLVFSSPTPDRAKIKLREFGEIADAHYRAYEWRTRFEVYFPLIISLINLPTALLYRGPIA